MYSLLRFILLTLIVKVLTTYSQNAAPIVSYEKGPGASSCFLYGGLDEECGFEVRLDDFPENCLSYSYVGVMINSSHDVYPTFVDDDLKKLHFLEQSKKPIFVSIGHDDYTAWTLILDSEGSNACIEAKNIIAFKLKHPGIKGLILICLQPDPDLKKFVGITQNLLKYIEIVKRETGLEIGIHFVEAYFIQYYENSTKMTWLDFSVLDSCVDFYVFTFYGSETICSAQFKDGVIPISGKIGYSLERLESAIQESKIPMNKIYFAFDLMPLSMKSFSPCEVNHAMKCMSPKNAKDWCSDTIETCFKKGQWAHKNGAGFMGNYIDLDDPKNCCGCGPFPTFDAIMAGFNGSSSVPTCPLYDRQV